MYYFLYRRLIQFVIELILVMSKAIRWMNEYKKNQTDFDNDMGRKLEIVSIEEVRKRNEHTY